MAITANFSWVKVSGSFSSPPFTIDFTDTSVGSPTTWFWDFGDGQSSVDQDPSHTYTTSGPFLIKLTVLKNEIITDINPTSSNIEKKAGTNQSTRAAAYTSWQGASWVSDTSDAEWKLQRISSTSFNYTARRRKFTWDLTGESAGPFYALYFGLNNGGAPNQDESGVTLIVGGTPYTINSGDAARNIGDVSSLVGLSLSSDIVDSGNYSALTKTLTVGASTGWLDFNSPVIKKHETSDIDSHSVSIGNPGVDFDILSTSSGTITPYQASGESPLTVQFRNLSAVPAGTTYSWLTREAGTNNTFIEVATGDTPPPIVFTKTG